jgi:hypothetical protein
MEICFAIFVNVLELDDSGQPVNEKYAEKRAATWICRYCTGSCRPASQTWNRGRQNCTDAERQRPNSASGGVRALI